MTERPSQPARHFMGWDAPLLPRAARWLLERFGPTGHGQVMVVVPGARAGRRLVELLVQESGAGGLVPPQVVTLGRLPELLCDAWPVAEPLQALLTRAWVLRQAERTVVESAIAMAPDPEDLLGWVRWAEELAGISQLLGGEGLSPADVAERAQRGELSQAVDSTRWAALGTLEHAYRQALADQGLVDQHAARAAALTDATDHGGDAVEGAGAQPLGFDTLVFIGVAEMPGLTQRLVTARLNQQPPSKADFDTHALIHAPASEADAFGPLGQLITDHWAERSLDLQSESIHVADRPRDQAQAVIQALGEASPAQELSPADCVVGVGDSDEGALVGSIRRHLEMSGIPCRPAAGLSDDAVSRSRPGRLLEAVGAYLDSRRFDDFAALLRHPDVGLEHEAAEDWLTLLDTYLSDHVQGRVTGQWLGAEGGSDGESNDCPAASTHQAKRAAKLKRVHERIEHWLPEKPDTLRPLPDWTGDLARMLTETYQPMAEGRDIDSNPSERFAPELFTALEQIGEALSELALLDAQAPTTPRVTADQAVSLLNRRVRDRTVPREADQAAVDVLGYLELVLDDAPLPIIVGLNEGSIPSSVTAHPLVPDTLRHTLGLPDNHRRLARDIYALTVITQSRSEAVVITGQRTTEGDPLAPSRLLLACDTQTLVERVNRFYSEAKSETLADQAAPLLEAGVKGGPTRLQVVKPGQGPEAGAEPESEGQAAPTEALTTLRVTAFGDYLACPYRFYLKHVLGLRPMDDQATEMDGAVFGNLAHDVLGAFGQSDLAQSTDAEKVTHFLHQQLDSEMSRRFGSEPVAAVRLQAQQLRERFQALAHRQVSWNLAGWRIMPQHIERKYEAQLEVDGQPFTITGRIDRIDQHDDYGYRIIDYKTADRGDSPDDTHRRDKKTRWVDLQLPLYRDLARSAGLDSNIDLGYVLLPRQVEHVGWAAAAWDDQTIDEAVDQAHEVIRSIRQGIYWPPADKPPTFDDGFKGLCYDRAVDRQAVLGMAHELNG